MPQVQAKLDKRKRKEKKPDKPRTHSWNNKEDKNKTKDKPRPGDSFNAADMSQRKLHAIIKQWHEPPRRSWARRQNKVDELPIDQTSWNPDRDDIQLPVRVAHAVSLSLIPRDLEQGGRPIQRSTPDSAADIHGEFRERLPMMLCVAFALASTVALILLYLDSPFRTRRDYETRGGDQNATSTQPLHHLQFTTFGHHDAAAEAADRVTVILMTRTMSMDEGSDNVSVVEERAVAATTGHRV